MERMQIFSLAVMIAGIIVVVTDALAVVYHWQVVPENIFIIGLCVVVIGLVLLWNSAGEPAPAWE
jgi:protein-S-isoprenylcysteine O-methyltransferase Ste14